MSSKQSNQENMNIIISGAGGQLGYDLCRKLRTKHEVQPYNSKELDITSATQIKKILTGNKIDVLVNCAAYTGVDSCEEEREKCFAVNATGPKLLSEYCRENNIRLIHISSDYVFDGQKKEPAPYTENEPTNPVSCYGRSKLAGEENIIKTMDNYLIIRTAWLYGINGHNFLKTMLRLAIKQPTKQIKVVNDQFGSLTWTFNLAEQIEQLIESNLKGIIHATAEGSTTWHDGACYFLEKMGIKHNITPCSTKEYPTPARRPQNSILDNSVLKAHKANLMEQWQTSMDKFIEKHKQRLIDECKK